MIIYVGDCLIGDSEIWENYKNDSWDDLMLLTYSELLNYNPTVRDLVCNDSIERRATASFEVVDSSRKFSILPGMETRIIFRDGFIFTGLVSSVRRFLEGSLSNGVLIHNVEVVDNTRIAERRLVAKAYIDKTAGEIVEALLNEFLAEEGVTAGDIYPGEYIDAITFPQLTVAECLNRLAEMSAYLWYIDYDRSLHFIPKSANTAEWHINNNLSSVTSFEIEYSDANYRNVQYILGSGTKTDTIVEYFLGDGVQKTFTLGYTLAETPVIKVNNVEVTTGVKGVDSGCDWYYAIGDNTIIQDQNATPLSSSDVLSVEYVGSFTLLVKVSSAAQITSRKNREGYGSGKYEAFLTDITINESDVAKQIARGILAEYSIESRMVQYTTHSKIFSGELQHIKIDSLGIDSDFLVTNVDARIVDPDENLIEYSVTAVCGPAEQSWESIFCQMAEAAKAKYHGAIGAKDVVLGAYTFEKTWQSTNRPNIFISVYPDSDTTPATDVFPCFDPDDINKYFVVYSNGAEVFRKIVTLRDFDDPSEFYTVAILNPAESNLTISHIGLWGGDSATNAAGSGIELSKYSFSYTKNELESLQFEFTDYKGW